MSQVERNASFETWRGAAIVAVVLLHASSTATSFDVGTTSYLFGVLLRQVVNFGVPIFFFLAGYFVVTGYRRARSTPAFWRTKLPRVLVPYLFWSLAFALLTRRELFTDPVAMVAALVTTDVVPIYYFLLMLAVMFAVTPALLGPRSTSMRHLLFVVSVIASVLSTYLPRLFWADGPLSSFPAYALNPLIWLPFYLFGLYIRSDERFAIHIRAAANRTGLFAALATAALALSVIEALYWDSVGMVEFAVSQTKLTSSLYAFSLILIASTGLSPAPKSAPLLAHLGSYAMGIYLLHHATLWITTKVLAGAEALREIQPAFVIVNGVLCLAATYLIVAAALKLAEIFRVGWLATAVLR